MIVELVNGCILSDVRRISQDEDGVATLHFDNDEIMFGIIYKITE